jgi:hypothetical protein
MFDEDIFIISQRYFRNHIPKLVSHSNTFRRLMKVKRRIFMTPNKGGGGITSRTQFCGTMRHSPIKPELSRKNRDQCDTYMYQVEGQEGRPIRQGGDNSTSKMLSNQGGYAGAGCNIVLPAF